MPPDLLLHAGLENASGTETSSVAFFGPPASRLENGSNAEKPTVVSSAPVASESVTERAWCHAWSDCGVAPLYFLYLMGYEP